MKVLILGGDGMLGHEVAYQLAETHAVTISLRESYRAPPARNCRSIHGIDLRDESAIARVMGEASPEVVINAAGIVKQRDAATDMLQSLEVNSLLPHRLARICAAKRARLIHISTDCVFSGERGNYCEDDAADASDIYGRTKLLGEVIGPNCLTLRTSIIGLELKGRRSLIEWYLQQRGEIKGFTRAIFSGLTTMELARLLNRVITEFPGLTGLYHVAAEPITKYELLRQLTEVLDRTDVRVVANDEYRCDRSLKSAKLERATGYRAPPWREMLKELGECIVERQAA